MALNFITDVRGNEPDLLAATKHLTLKIRDLDGATIKTIPAPATGWTHDRLLAIAARHEDLVFEGADAYLGDCWVGSTEV
ncbi:MAG: hypothetical protein ITG07_02405 [Candidimonas sp.]|nr:hypothetical protein [Candidimonas sp.]